MLVWLQLCNPQGVSLFSFVRLPPRVSRPLAGAPVHDMSLAHGERLRAVGCGLKGNLVRLLSLGKGRHFEAQVSWCARHQMMHSIALRLASKCMAAVRDKAAKEAEELCSSGQFAAAVGPLQLAGRRARLAAAQGLDEAQYQLGIMYDNGFGVVLDDAEALRWHQIAAAQGYPEAFFSVAVNHEGNDVDSVCDATVEAIRWYRRAQAAGDSFASEELQRLKKKTVEKILCLVIQQLNKFYST
jgi:hypothetical protein